MLTRILDLLSSKAPGLRAKRTPNKPMRTRLAIERLESRRVLSASPFGGRHAGPDDSGDHGGHHHDRGSHRAADVGRPHSSAASHGSHRRVHESNRVNDRVPLIMRSEQQTYVLWIDRSVLNSVAPATNANTQPMLTDTFVGEGEAAAPALSFPPSSSSSVPVQDTDSSAATAISISTPPAERESEPTIAAPTPDPVDRTAAATQRAGASLEFGMNAWESDPLLNVATGAANQSRSELPSHRWSIDASLELQWIGGSGATRRDDLRERIANRFAATDSLLADLDGWLDTIADEPRTTDPTNASRDESLQDEAMDEPLESTVEDFLVLAIMDVTRLAELAPRASSSEGEAATDELSADGEIVELDANPEERLDAPEDAVIRNDGLQSRYQAMELILLDGEEPLSE